MAVGNWIAFTEKPKNTLHRVQLQRGQLTNMTNGILSVIALDKPMVDKIPTMYTGAILRAIERFIIACFVLKSFDKFLKEPLSTNKPHLPSVF